MKEHLLSDSDRAALQSLIPLASALGAGTIFALFFGGRRRGSGIAVFELFAIVAVLTAVATTAYFCIALLHRGTAISDRELTETATPLIVAVFLLVFISVGARLPGSAQRIFAILPLALLGALGAAWLGSSAWTATPEDASLVAGLILCGGAVAALLAWGADRLYSRSDRNTERKRFVDLSNCGYRVAEKELRLALPGGGRSGKPPGVAEKELRLALPGGGRSGKPPVVSCWTRKQRVYLDADACAQLCERTRARWDRLAEDKGKPPGGAAVLTRVQLSHILRALRRKRVVRFSIFEPGVDEDPDPRAGGKREPALRRHRPRHRLALPATRCAARTCCGTSGRCRRGL